MLQTGEYSIIGDRKSQQDISRLERKKNGLLLAVVCDGMGGMQGGELASTAGIEAVFEDFASAPLPSDEKAPSWIHGALSLADRRVFELEGPDGDPLGGGSTCVLALADNDSFIWGSVGDSRIYLLSAGKIYKINRMHNYNLQLDTMLRNGEITADERKTMGARGEALISYLGIGKLPLLDIGASAMHWRENDVLILCSDGIYKSLENDQIQAITEEAGGNMQLAAERLCSEAYRLATGHQDNTTVITIRYSSL